MTSELRDFTTDEKAEYNRLIAQTEYGKKKAKQLTKKDYEGLLDIVCTHYGAESNPEAHKDDLIGRYLNYRGIITPYSRESVRAILYTNYVSKGGWRPINEYMQDFVNETPNCELSLAIQHEIVCDSFTAKREM